MSIGDFITRTKGLIDESPNTVDVLPVRQSRKVSTMPSSQCNMQILLKKRTFPQGMYEEKCKTAASNCQHPQL